MTHSDPAFGLSMRQPPMNAAAEMALLGAMLCNNKAVSMVEDIVRPEHFGDPAHGRIYDLIVAGCRQGHVMDAITLRSRLENDGMLAEVGGAEYLGHLVTAMVGILNCRDYGRAIRDAWVRRTLIADFGPVIDQCFAPPDGGAQAIIESAETTLLRIAQDAGEDEPTTPFGLAVGQAVQNTRKAMLRGDGLSGVSSGYAATDRMLMGLIPENMLLLAARPSMGKTGLALGIATRAAAAGTRTLLWSGEMSAAQLGARGAAAYANLDTVAVFTARRLKWASGTDAEAPREELSKTDWLDLAAAERAAALLPLEIDARSAITVAQLRGRARRMKRQKAGLGLIIVDYVGLMRGSEAARRQGKYAETTEISADLKALAKELKVPVIALCQLNRSSESRDDKRPTMSDLRDSGALEQDADAIVLLHRPHYYLSRAGRPDKRANETAEAFANRCSEMADRTTQSEGVAELIVTKNRHGPTGVTRLRFTDRTTWFRDESEDPLGPAWGGHMETAHHGA